MGQDRKGNQSAGCVALSLPGLPTAVSAFLRAILDPGPRSYLAWPGLPCLSPLGQETRFCLSSLVKTYVINKLADLRFNRFLVTHREDDISLLGARAARPHLYVVEQARRLRSQLAGYVIFAGLRCLTLYDRAGISAFNFCFAENPLFSGYTKTAESLCHES